MLNTMVILVRRNSYFSYFFDFDDFDEIEIVDFYSHVAYHSIELDELSSNMYSMSRFFHRVR